MTEKDVKDAAREARQEEVRRPLYEIAHEIAKDWKKVYFGAVPYLDALKSLDKIEDTFYQDGADFIVRYFLSNATTWRGETARRIKKELKGLLK